MSKKKEASAAEKLAALELEQTEKEKEIAQAFKAKREKLVEEATETLRAERTKLHQDRRDIDVRLAAIEKEIAKVSGRENMPTGPVRQKKRSRRLSDEQKLDMGKAIHARLAKSKGNEFKSKDLQPFCISPLDQRPVPPREIVRLWNEKGAENNGQKIKSAGEKALTRYSLPA